MSKTNKDTFVFGQNLDNGQYFARCLPLGLTAYGDTPANAVANLVGMFTKLLYLGYK